jgi:MerR HTH family regulatory protein
MSTGSSAARSPNCARTADRRAPLAHTLLTLSYDSVIVERMAADDATWTIDQLSELVADALSDGSAGQSNGRVREVPDIRTIRWYTSIGLLDRPAAMRGRTALYGRRHLVQIVAVKRLQADGHTLARVQEQLIGVDDLMLERIARVSDSVAGTRSVTVTSEPAVVGAERGRFWSAPPVASVSAPPAPIPPVALTAPAPAAAPSATPPTPLVQGIRLTEDVTLLLGALDHAPDEAALAAVHDAARPLLELLRQLGLTPTR